MENSALNISLSLSDSIVIGLFFIVLIIIALASAKKSKAGVEDYFLGGRKMPWWLLGISMVACTFSADTPNLVSGMVRETGVAKNWAWWSFLITGMTTVFIFAKLWRRTGIMTDLEFYEKRYAGKAAGFLRGFRAVYLGFFFQRFNNRLGNTRCNQNRRSSFRIKSFDNSGLRLVVRSYLHLVRWF